MSVYGALLARPGARALTLACALGWLSFGGLTLAVVLAVERATGSFSLAGGVAAAFAAASALLAPLRGRLVDRRGDRALLVFACVHGAALVGLAATGTLVGDAGAAGAAIALLACAGLAGACAPPLIAAARARWAGVAGPGLARSGHALNALLGDLGGIAGPAVAALVATAAAPAAAPALLALGPVAGAFLLVDAVPPSPEPELCHPIHAQPASNDKGPAHATAGTPAAAPASGRGVVRGNRGMQALLAGDLLAGALLGTAELVAPARAAAAGAPQLGALPLGLLAAGSALAALWSGRSRRAGDAPQRARRGLLLMAVALPAGLLAAFLPLCLAFPVAGVGYGLFTVALMELLDELVEQRNAVEALTWLTSAQGAGLALGALVGGLAG
jgi:MFS family permease